LGACSTAHQRQPATLGGKAIHIGPGEAGVAVTEAESGGHWPGRYRPPVPAGQPPAHSDPTGTPAGGHQSMTQENKAQNRQDHSVPAAVALKYDGERAPIISATGTWELAEEIIRIAREHDVPLYENAELAGILA